MSSKSIIVGGCRYPINYFNVAYPLFSCPSGGVFIKSAQHYNDYEYLLKKRLDEERKAREYKQQKYNDYRARKFWSRYFQGFFAKDEDPKEHSDIDYPYNVFGLKKSASQEDMKREYRKSILKTHPDRGGTGEAFRKIQEAYEYFKSMIS